MLSLPPCPDSCPVQCVQANPRGDPYVDRKRKQEERDRHKNLQRELANLQVRDALGSPFIVGSVESALPSRPDTTSDQSLSSPSLRAFINSDTERYSDPLWAVESQPGHLLSNPFEGWLVVVMDFLEGHTLQHMIQTHTERGMPIPHTLSIMEQAIRGLSDLHSAGIMHRDIKPDNIMVHMRPPCDIRPQLETQVGEELPRVPSCTQATWVDLGVSRRVVDTEGEGEESSESEYSDSECSDTSVLSEASDSLSEGENPQAAALTRMQRGMPCAPGAILYNAPECWMYQEYALPSDIWAMGLVFSQMLARDWVFKGISEHTLKHMLTMDCGKIDKTHTAIPELPELVNSMLKVDPTQRPTCTDLLQWIDDIKAQMARDHLTRLDSRVSRLYGRADRVRACALPSDWAECAKSIVCADATEGDSTVGPDATAYSPERKETREEYLARLEGVVKTLDDEHVAHTGDHCPYICKRLLSTGHVPAHVSVERYHNSPAVMLERENLRVFYPSRASQQGGVCMSQDWSQRLEECVEKCREQQKDVLQTTNLLKDLPSIQAHVARRGLRERLSLKGLDRPLRAEGFASLVAEVESITQKEPALFDCVTEVDLSGNAISTDGLAGARLAMLHRCFPNVKLLNLQGNSMVQIGMEELVQELATDVDAGVVKPMSVVYKEDSTSHHAVTANSLSPTCCSLWASLPSTGPRQLSLFEQEMKELIPQDLLRERILQHPTMPDMTINPALSGEYVPPCPLCHREALLRDDVYLSDGRRVKSLSNVGLASMSKELFLQVMDTYDPDNEAATDALGSLIMHVEGSALGKVWSAYCDENMPLACTYLKEWAESLSDSEFEAHMRQCFSVDALSVTPELDLPLSLWLDKRGGVRVYASEYTLVTVLARSCGRSWRVNKDDVESLVGRFLCTLPLCYDGERVSLKSLSWRQCHHPKAQQTPPPTSPPTPAPALVTPPTFVRQPSTGRYKQKGAYPCLFDMVHLETEKALGWKYKGKQPRHMDICMDGCYMVTHDSDRGLLIDRIQCPIELETEGPRGSCVIDGALYVFGLVPDYGSRRSNNKTMGTRTHSHGAAVEASSSVFRMYSMSLDTHGWREMGRADGFPRRDMRFTGYDGRRNYAPFWAVTVRAFALGGAMYVLLSVPIVKNGQGVVDLRDIAGWDAEDVEWHTEFHRYLPTPPFGEPQWSRLPCDPLLRVTSVFVTEGEGHAVAHKAAVNVHERESDPVGSYPQVHLAYDPKKAEWREGLAVHEYGVDSCALTGGRVLAKDLHCIMMEYRPCSDEWVYTPKVHWEQNSHMCPFSRDSILTYEQRSSPSARHIAMVHYPIAEERNREREDHPSATLLLGGAQAVTRGVARFEVAPGVTDTVAQPRAMKRDDTDWGVSARLVLIVPPVPEESRSWTLTASDSVYLSTYSPCKCLLHHSAGTVTVTRRGSTITLRGPPGEHHELQYQCTCIRGHEGRVEISVGQVHVSWACRLVLSPN
ncbi:hypothetical protein KIPB_000310 [Kipferlia bialata]|uniref:Protein kinase domain-containing protein n=1 Tax=Kipferlia bialata TaxID=797122 RepID=A0A9K3CQB0_9EUKA|nr:hypothetical protein KIPB_000310 [Kipferlia bialata]|eukprot:g310.t1